MADMDGITFSRSQELFLNNSFELFIDLNKTRKRDSELLFWWPATLQLVSPPYLFS